MSQPPPVGQPAPVRPPFATRQVAAANAARACELFGLSLLPGTEHMLVVKETRTHVITLHQTTFNWRLSKIPLRSLAMSENGYCYTGRSAFFLAYNEAAQWPEDDEGSYVPGLWYRDDVSGVPPPRIPVRLRRRIPGWKIVASDWYLREVIWAEIQASGRTQAEVCEAVGVTQKHLSSYLNGRNGMQLELVDRILLELGRELVLSTRVCQQALRR